MIAWLHDKVFMSGKNSFVRGVILFRIIGVFKIRSVINECANLEAPGELRHAADVIAMEVRDENVVNLLQACRFRSGNNAVCVASFIPRPSGVN